MPKRLTKRTGPPEFTALAATRPFAKDGYFSFSDTFFDMEGPRTHMNWQDEMPARSAIALREARLARPLAFARLFRINLGEVFCAAVRSAVRRADNLCSRRDTTGHATRLVAENRGVRATSGYSDVGGGLLQKSR